MFANPRHIKSLVCNKIYSRGQRPQTSRYCLLHPNNNLWFCWDKCSIINICICFEGFGGKTD